MFGKGIRRPAAFESKEFESCALFSFEVFFFFFLLTFFSCFYKSLATTYVDEECCLPIGKDFWYRSDVSV